MPRKQCMGERFFFFFLDHCVRGFSSWLLDSVASGTVVTQKIMAGSMSPSKEVYFMAHKRQTDRDGSKIYLLLLTGCGLLKTCSAMN